MATIEIQIGDEKYRCGINKGESGGSPVYTVYVERIQEINLVKTFRLCRHEYSENCFSLDDATDNLRRVIKNMADDVEDESDVKQAVETNVRSLAETNDAVEILE